MTRDGGDPGGRMLWGGCDCAALAATYGTPLYVIDEGLVRQAMRRYTAAARAAYPGLRVAYSSKAFLCGAMAALALREGLWMDVVSGGELDLALAAGFPASRILFQGNNKSTAELAFGLEAGVSRFVVDNFEELGRLSALAAAAGRRAPIELRITPGISPHTHRAVQTGQVDSKFGFPIADGLAARAIRTALGLPWLDLCGLHSHIGSQVASLYPFRLTAATLCRLAWQAWREEGYLVRELNFGGGLASGRLPADVQPTVEEYVRAVTGAFRRAWRRHGEVGAAFGGQGEVAAATVGRSEVAAGRVRAVGRKRLPWPELFVEPGRSVIAEAGITLYTVGAVKPVPGHEPYVLVDGGMADNPRPALYGARYRAVLANRPADAASGSYTLAGKACESGDILVRGLELPEPRPGDLVAVLATGAYTHSMASNYNRLPRPAVVFASGGQARLAVRRETYADLARCDLELTGRAEPAAEGVAEVAAEAVAEAEAEAVPEAVAAGTKGRAAPRR